METSPFAQLRQIILERPELLAQLRTAPDEAQFLATLATLSAQLGCPLSPEALANELRRARQAWIERDLWM